MNENDTTSRDSTASASGSWRPSAWVNFKDAAVGLSGTDGRNKFSPRQLHRAALRGDLRAIRINHRGDWRTTAQWLDEYLVSLQGRPFTRRRKRASGKNGNNVAQYTGTNTKG
jgi:hypothetical protein